MGLQKLTIRDVPLEGQTVLVRADYNVPIDDDGKIRDDLRVRASLPTLEYLLEHHCKVVIMSHLGRPDGAPQKKYSLAPVAELLEKLLGRKVLLAPDCIGDQALQAVKKSPSGSVVLLENLRFHPEEEANDEAFARELARVSGARYFVQDGFGVVHRAHASTDAITHSLPSVAGLLLEREYTTLTQAIDTPKRPMVAILGGAKVSDKLGVIEHFVERADTILIGGAMANTFLAYRGYSMGASKVESDQTNVLDAIYAAATKKVGESNVDAFLRLPTDLAVASEISDAAPRRVVAIDALRPTDIALDIGDRTIATYTGILTDARTAIWNGPMGYSELPNFAHGSARIALALATNEAATSIIGGGDTADFVRSWDGDDGKSFTHVSTGGGAGLELMAGVQLPGITALLDARR